MKRIGQIEPARAQRKAPARRGPRSARAAARRETRPQYGRAFLLLFHDEILRLTQRKMRPTAWRLLFWSLCHLDFREYRRVRQGDIAESLEIEQGVVSKAFAELRTAGVIERDGDRPSYCRLSLRLGWRGGARAYIRERDARGIGDSPSPPHPASGADGCEPDDDGDRDEYDDRQLILDLGDDALPEPKQYVDPEDLRALISMLGGSPD